MVFVVTGECCLRGGRRAKLNPRTGSLSAYCQIDELLYKFRVRFSIFALYLFSKRSG